MSSEANLERHFMREVKLRGGWAIKMNPIGLRGIPDRLVLMPGGRVIFVELKTDRGRLSKIQQAVHRKLLALGMTVETLKGRGDIDEWLENF